MLSYLQDKLNDEQYQAAIYNKTSSLIIAGAGSGKTRTLTYKIAKLILHDKVPSDHIFGVTFTNKAANELKERLMRIIDEMSAEYNIPSPIEQDYHLPPRMQSDQFKRIGTFHALFLKLLKDHIEDVDMGYKKGFTIYDPSEVMTIIKKIVKKFALKEVFEPKEVRAQISKWKNEGYDMQSFKQIATDSYESAVAKVYEEYHKQLVIANALDFDDLLLLPYLLFKKKNNILAKWQNHFQYIMVDEAQDTNWIQFELMKMLSGNNDNITFIGDDFQSIYGRRGAVMENFLNLKRYRPTIKMFKLQTNYRSKPHIVEAGNALIKQNTHQYEKNITAHRTGTDKIKIFAHPNDIAEAANVIDFITKLQANNNNKRSDFAILYRTNAQSSVFEKIFIQEGIPYKIYGAFKFFDRKEVKDVVAYLKFILNPHDNVALTRIINTPKRKIGKSTIDTIIKYATDHNQSMFDTIMSSLDSIDIDLTTTKKGSVYTFGKLVNKWQHVLNDTDPADLITMIINDINYQQYLIKEEGKELGKEKYENIGQLINMAEKYSIQDEEHDKNGEDEKNGKFLLHHFLEEITLMTDMAMGDAEEVNAIKLMTVHSSKGLEFPYVFVVGLEENIFPLGNARLDPNELEEERRLCYVAITRAQNHVFLSYCNSRMQRGRWQNNSPSRFLEEIPCELVQKYELGEGGGNGGYKRNNGPALDVGDRVIHKLFGEGEIVEVRNNMCVVKFEGKWGVRKMEPRFLELL